MRKLALTASALLLAFGVAACDQGPQQAQEPSTPSQPSGSPQQGMAPSQKETPPPAAPTGSPPAERAPSGSTGSTPPSGGSSQ